MMVTERTDRAFSGHRVMKINRTRQQGQTLVPERCDGWDGLGTENKINR